jgi:hypothetical protein
MAASRTMMSMLLRRRLPAYPWPISLFVHLMGWLGAFPTRLTQPCQLSALIHRLRPQPCGIELTRLGPDSDGGYLLPRDFEGLTACLAGGVGRNSDFERDCADQLGLDVYLLDGSVNQPGCNHQHFQFQSLFLGPSVHHNTITLDAWLKELPIQSEGDLILKLDIEGSEYETLLSATPEFLHRCRIIVMECHFLDQLWSEPFFRIASGCFEKLLITHACVHLHPNNRTGLLQHRGLTIPAAMEFTFLRRDRLTRHDAVVPSYPHPLDRDNMRSYPTVVLPDCWKHTPCP